MIKHHPDNERTKRRYLEHWKESEGKSEATVDAIAAALDRFECYTKHRDFKAFRREQAIGFKARLADQLNARTGDKLSKATIYSTLRYLRAFFRWLAGQPGFRSKLTYDDANCFNLNDKDTRIAKTRRDTAFPTLAQIAHVMATMPAKTDIELRNRAVVAFILLTGARDGATASFKLKHVDLAKAELFHDAREVRTKASKSCTTWFFPVGNEPLRIVTEWITHLRDDLHWGNDDALFPKTRIAVGAQRTFVAVGLERSGWSNAQPIRDIFRDAFTRAGLRYFNPHSIRNTLTQLGQRTSKDVEEFKSWSQNLGHNGVLTTLMSYGAVEPARQAEIMRAMWNRPEAMPDPADLLRALVRDEVERMTAEKSQTGSGACGGKT